MTNPHATTFVDALAERVDISADCPGLEAHPYFAARTNVEFQSVKA